MKRQIRPFVVVTALTLMGLSLGATLVASETVDEPEAAASV
jgi:hypothetical protein